MQSEKNAKETCQIYTSDQPPTPPDFAAIADFLFLHLERFGDPLQDIEACMKYALQITPSPGGLLVTSRNGDEITGAVIVNRTGMKDYIPENILVYIATHKDYRGKGLGKQLMQLAIENTSGAIALHVEPDNPAKQLYEKLGFTNKYLEMRLKR